MPQCECGASFDDGDRFCRVCGRGLRGQPGLVPLLEPDVRASTESVTTEVRRPSTGLLLVGLVAAVVAVGWLLATGSDEDVTPDDEAAPTTVTTRSSADPQQREEATAAIASTTTSGAPAETAVEEVDGAPLLGAEVGYRLIVSTTGRPAVIDLDTGTTRYTEGSRVFPVAITGSWLVVDRATPGGLARLPLDELAAEPASIFDVDDAAATFLSSPSGQINPRSIFVTVIRQTEDPSEIDDTLYVVDPVSGDATERPDGTVFEFGALWTDPEDSLFTGPAGGVYTRTGPGGNHRLVSDGRLLAADDRRALVQRCDVALRCTLTWLDRQSWEPLDLYVPADQESGTVMLHGTDWLLETTFDVPITASLLNISTGTSRDIRPPESGFRGRGVLPAITPDGQWLAEVTDQPRVIAITNLTTGETTEIELSEAATQPLFFVES